MGWWGKYIGSNPSMREIRSHIEADTSMTVTSIKFGYAICVVDEQAVIKHTHWQDAIEAGKNPLNYIVVALWRVSEGQLMIKQVSEDMGPCHYDIPMKYINKECELMKGSKFATEWRQRVREYHANRKAQIKLMRSFTRGQTIYCYGEPYTFSYVKNRNWCIATNQKNNRTYRLRPWQVSNIAKDLPEGCIVRDK